jgi:hypothetical protein
MQALQKARETKKGKEKHHHEDDVPPKLTPDLQRIDNLLDELKRHWRCEEHSEPDFTMYCWIEPTGEGKGGHCELKFEDMLLWAKWIVSQKKT